MQSIENFAAFGFDATIQEAIACMGFKKPTPIQQQAIPMVMNGQDLIACAQTGTGKTGAFLLPMLQKLSVKEHKKGVQALIIVPTRELALQIDQQLEAMAYFTNLSSISIYGGGDGLNFDQQKTALKDGVDVVVATPGKLLSHLNLGYVDINELEFLVLDEADRMLDMGFFEDILRIHKFLPAKKQTLMFSATMPTAIRKLAKTMLNEPGEISLSISKPAAGVTQLAYLVHEDDKIKLLKEILDTHKDYKSIIVFASTKSTVKFISAKLQMTNYPAKSIHSDKEQSEREQILSDFKSRRLRVLIATDVVSRGIDVDNINLVLNFNVPHDAEDYVHRVGRTARAESKGTAITFINPAERRQFTRIEALIETEINKPELSDAYQKVAPYDPAQERAARTKPRFQQKRKPKQGAKRPTGAGDGKTQASNPKSNTDGK